MFGLSFRPPEKKLARATWICITMSMKISDYDRQIERRPEKPRVQRGKLAPNVSERLIEFVQSWIVRTASLDSRSR